MRFLAALAFARLTAGDAIPAIFIAPWDAPIGQVIADLLLVVECSEQSEWEGQIHYLPL